MFQVKHVIADSYQPPLPLVSLARQFDYEFAVLEEHRRQMERSLARAIEDLGTVEIKVENFVIDQAHQEAQARKYREHTELLPTLQWNAQLVLAYSTFEHSLNELCRLAQAEAKSGISLRNFRQNKKKMDTGIFKARAYLGYIAGITKPFSTGAWTTAVKLNKLRNVIAHSNGFVSDPPSREQIAVKAAFSDNVNLQEVYGVDMKLKQFRPTSQLVHNAIHSLAQVIKDICEDEPKKRLPGSQTAKQLPAARK